MCQTILLGLHYYNIEVKDKIFPLFSMSYFDNIWLYLYLYNLIHNELVTQTADWIVNTTILPSFFLI